MDYLLVFFEVGYAMWFMLRYTMCFFMSVVVIAVMWSFVIAFVDEYVNFCLQLIGGLFKTLDIGTC